MGEVSRREFREVRGRVSIGGARAPSSHGRAASAEASLLARIRASASPSPAPAVPARLPRPRLPPAGVSAACLLAFLSDSSPSRPSADQGGGHTAFSTRRAVAEIKRQRKEESEGRAGASYADGVRGQTHYVTDGDLTGPAAVHVVHAWDADLRDLVECLVQHSGGDLDQRYAVDAFTTDLFVPAEDPVAAVQASIAGASHVLLVLDAEGIAFRRLFVLFEALLAQTAGKLSVACSASGGFGCSEEALRLWEKRLDGGDWESAETTRKSDDKRIRAFADKTWETGGKGIERMLARMKIELRKDIYGQVLIGAVEQGDLKAVKLSLELGADPSHKDKHGNTAEELAAFNGREDIEEAIFARRLAGQPGHLRLSEYLDEGAFGQDQLDSLGSFLTESAKAPGVGGTVTAMRQDLADVTQSPFHG